MVINIEHVAYSVGAFFTAVAALTVFAMKNPDAHQSILEPRISKAVGILWACSFGALVMGLYSQIVFGPVLDPTKAKDMAEVKSLIWLLPVSGFGLAILLFGVQLWLYSIARDSKKLKTPIKDKE